MIESLLKWMAGLRLPLWWGSRLSLSVGELNALDAVGSLEWKKYRSAMALFDAWAPAPGSLWEAYHCPTLFASLDQISAETVGVAPDTWFPEWLRGSLPLPRWLDSQTWLILDASGLISTAVAAGLADLQLCQPVCTFDNWPHPRGLLKSEVLLAGLIRFAPVVARARRSFHKGLPPVWVCDSQRLGKSPGRPREFDNRYFLDDSILPGHEILRQHGLQRIVYAKPRLSDSVTPDIVAYLESMRKLGLEIWHMGLASEDDWTSGPEPLEPVPLPNFNESGFFRSTAGGFGVPIPEPSSSSG